MVKTGQFICYKTGQIHLLLTVLFDKNLLRKRLTLFGQGFEPAKEEEEDAFKIGDRHGSH